MSKKRPKKPRRYSDDERATALAALAANGGNLARTAKQLGIPGTTLKQWAKGQRHPEAAQMSDQKKGDLADALEGVAWKLAEAAPDKIPFADLKNLAVALGIVIDKMQILRNKPTSITGQAGDDDLAGLSDDELAREIAETRARAGKKVEG